MRRKRVHHGCEDPLASTRFLGSYDCAAERVPLTTAVLRQMVSERNDHRISAAHIIASSLKGILFQANPWRQAIGNNDVHLGRSAPPVRFPTSNEVKRGSGDAIGLHKISAIQGAAPCGNLVLAEVGECKGILDE
jgi:hypothetical protein